MFNYNKLTKDNIYAGLNNAYKLLSSVTAQFKIIFNARKPYQNIILIKYIKKAYKSMSVLFNGQTKFSYVNLSKKKMFNSQNAIIIELFNRLYWTFTK